MFKHLLARAQEARAAELEGESGLEGGFTLIELMVVLLIIAILLAIAIPTFLGVSGSARDRSAQSNATNALTNSIAFYQNGQTFDNTSDTGGTGGATLCSEKSTSSGCAAGDVDTPTALSSSEPAFNWVNGATDCHLTANNPSKCVSILPVDVNGVNDGQGVILAVYSPTGTCWFAMNLQATPNATGADTATGFSGAAATSPSEATAGTYYAKVVNASTCEASSGQAFAGTKWAASYSKAT